MNFGMCGRWRNGRLASTCTMAGTEECDFECPHRDEPADHGMEATVANCGGAVLVNVPLRSGLCDPTCAEESLGGKRCNDKCVALEIPPMDAGGVQRPEGEQR